MIALLLRLLLEENKGKVEVVIGKKDFCIEVASFPPGRKKTIGSSAESFFSLSLSQ